MFAILIAAATAAVTSASATDVCLAMVPPRLAAVIQREHPGLALPTLNDAPVERLLANSARGGWPCPFVAIADVDGDDNLDRALVLKSQADATVRLIVARNEEGQWRIELVKDLPLAIGAAVVEPLEAGLYEQTKGGRDAVKEVDNLKSIQADHAGFLAGDDAGAQHAFFYVNEKWDSLWLERGR